MITLDSPLSTYTARQLSRLSTFLTALIGVALIGLPFYTFMGLLLDQPILLLMNIWCVAALAIALRSRALMRQGQPAKAALSFGVGISVYAVTLTPLFNLIWPGIALIALGGAIFALPYLDRRQAGQMLTATALCSQLILIGAQIPAIQHALPDVHGVVLLGVTLFFYSAEVGLLLLVLWQSSNQSREVLQAMEHINHHLQASQAAEAAARQNEQMLRAAETASRQHLETTVATYLGFVEQITWGDLTCRLNVVADGVLGELGHGLNRMRTELHRLTTHVHAAANAIAATSATILAATSQQASSAAEQATAMTQTVTSVIEIKVIAAQTTEQAHAVAHQSEEALTVAQQGTRAVEATINGMQHMRRQVGQIAQTMLALAEQTQAVGLITSTVSNLAEQSNLLALNAAIEAARAGEHGKSFAVVAQQVRELAERSKGATHQIRLILADIERATSTAVFVTEEGTKRADVGAQLSAEAGQVIHQIASAVKSTTQATVQIAAAAQQQTAGIEQIDHAMSAMEQATAQALGSTRHAEAAARDLHTLAQSLQAAIAAYRL